MNLSPVGEVWSFGEPEDESNSYADGTIVPGRHQDVYLNGTKVGYIEIHMHKRRGRDGLTDASFGITTCIYGPLPGGK